MVGGPAIKAYTFHNEFHTIAAHLTSALGDITIKRFDSDSTVQNTIKIRWVYGPKQRVMADLVQKKANYSVPVGVLYLTGGGRDASRVTNPMSALQYSRNPHSNRMTNVAPPVPYSIQYGLTFYSAFGKDMDQMITNWVPYFDPYLMLSWSHPQTGQEIQSRVMWNEQVSYEYPNDLGDTSPWEISATTGFTVDGWLFKGDQRPARRIVNIHASFTPVRTIECNYADLIEYRRADTTECFSILGAPRPLSTSIVCIRENTATQISIYGHMFKDVTGVYVSGGAGVTVPSTSANTVFNPASSSASAMCTAFNAAAIPAFVVSDVVAATKQFTTPIEEDIEQYSVYRGNRQPLSHPWNMITFEIPPIQGSGYIDIIVTTPAGCGSLATSSFVEYTNPYPPTNPAYETWVEPDQPPWYGVGIPVGGG